MRRLPEENPVKPLKILYAGDSPAGGPANYLLGILGDLGVHLLHLPPGKTLEPRALNRTAFDAVLFSDYSKSRVPSASEKLLCRQIRAGMGFMMIGGWGSFAGPFGGWQGSELEGLLPVECLSRDDRLNFPGGAVLRRERQHPLFKGLDFRRAPVICGMNRLIVKKTSEVLLNVRPLVSDGDKVSFSREKLPLLVLSKGPGPRTAALATDLAPHWCGGIVDWGVRTRRLQAAPGIHIEVGNFYVSWVQSMVRWAAGRV